MAWPVTQLSVTAATMWRPAPTFSAYQDIKNNMNKVFKWCAHLQKQKEKGKAGLLIVPATQALCDPPAQSPEEKCNHQKPKPAKPVFTVKANFILGQPLHVSWQRILFLNQMQQWPPESCSSDFLLKIVSSLDLSVLYPTHIFSCITIFILAGTSPPQ